MIAMLSKNSFSPLKDLNPWHLCAPLKSSAEANKTRQNGER